MVLFEPVLLELADGLDEGILLGALKIVVQRGGTTKYTVTCSFPAAAGDIAQQFRADTGQEAARDKTNPKRSREGGSGRGESDGDDAGSGVAEIAHCRRP
jgi:hypothetical protein